jgi:protein tyrosine phosphatase (PTP) superfamily phosphohydrolase (DUF442 family)
LTASVLLFAFGGLAQVYARDSELPNFHQVNAQVYRGGQPKAGGLEKLKAMGIRTILNLRGEDDHSRAEGDAAQRLGLRYYSISLPGFSNPKDEEVDRVLEIINALENQPVFVHCHHGKDRTGTIIASYRISHDGWNAEQAKAEAKRYGLSWVQFGMKNYIDHYYARQQGSGMEQDWLSVQSSSRRESLIRTTALPYLLLLSETRIGQSRLALIFAAAIFVADIAVFI